MVQTQPQVSKASRSSCCYLKPKQQNARTKKGYLTPPFPKVRAITPLDSTRADRDH
ncbi:hypothetical protein SLEP1_g30866 [Rubroshorea leprosula]|uniref:Uncharacterized protein n=1 Tax=Rubroshorea leprosula TaxID=152421 RepID=A0AAV5KAX1_9ROSI|nr:hypothetical protein SLEP1_g30866 [Rubroshorea leprosula]